MQFFTTVFAAIVLAAPVFAAPAPLRKFHGRYIVKLKDGVAKSKVLIQLKNSEITHEWSIVHGFAGQFSEDAVNVLRASSDVEYIAEDEIVTTSATQTNAPWGLARLSKPDKLANQNTRDLTFSYTYDNYAGFGVDVYVVDTGIYTAHSDFGGRARWGATFGGYPDTDGNGHGTHVAGIVAGTQFGVAKAANVIAVKVLSGFGSGSISDVISGLDWVASSVAASGRPSIATLALAIGSTSIPLDNAVTSLVDRGIHVTVAAGNSNTDAGSTSPARAAGAITVGASTITDARASFSNYGAVVDIFAPGENIISAWIGSTTATNNLSGTSIATPHVAGLVAYLISKHGNSPPAAITALIKSLSVKGILAGIRTFCVLRGALGRRDH
ncbi:hypothetical protein DXG03_007590 [Asterophora parasitica]|uniref:Uncharacterized protein n=1 Tax=Asterophora parasitica TaxID=117018 RepID=A0A9P7FYK8_9AGAR|nr:hypothetical protein DXG03_007590 [Asterophora parasitica]